MQLNFRRFGKGPPLIILHGLLGSSENWLTIAKKVSSVFTVFLPDQRNHGLSPHNEIHDYDSMSNDIYEFAEGLDMKKLFLAGHSMGGKTAMKFAMSWPEMLQGLMIADISPVSGEKDRLKAYKEHYNILKSIKETDITEVTSRTDADNMLADKIPEGKVRSLILKNLQRDENKKFFWKINADILLNNLDNIVEEIPFVHPVTGFPVIFLKGELSDYISEKDYSVITRYFPAAEIRIIRNAGHWLHAENPEAVAEALLDLLDL